MKKLLHERLREIADEKEDEPYSSGIIEALCKEFGVCENKSSYGVDLCNCLKAIADEIEKYYIPRPRFEDGEPVQFGEEFADCSGNPHTLHEIRYRDKAVAGLGAKCLLEANTTSPKDYDGISFNLYDGTFVKRPEPKVLDADGFEIKAGQTRWHIPTGKKVTIKDLGINKKTAGDSVGLLGGSWVSPLSLTLKEPDSMEKILVDMMGDNHMRGTSYIRRIQSLMERDADGN